MAERLDREAGDAETELRRSAYRELAEQWRRLAHRYETPTLFEPELDDAGELNAAPRSARRRLN